MLCSSCNYLDIVPEERTKEEDTYSTPGRIKEFLASCYSYLPTTRQILTESYDMICAEKHHISVKRHSQLSMKEIMGLLILV